MTDSAGSDAQVRLIAEQLVDAAMIKVKPTNEVPQVFKWLAGLAAVIVAAAIVGYFNWLTNTVSSMQLTLTRVDERQSAQVLAQDARFGEIDRRLVKVEAAQSAGQK